jgi:glutathione S-transferase
MSYRLIGSYTSPFVRRLRLAMHDRVDYELEAVNYNGSR